MLINCLNVCNKIKHEKSNYRKKLVWFVTIGPIKNLVTRKTASHLRLEQALKQNKETILRSLVNGSMINELRRQASSLTDELTTEIKREYKEEQEFCKSEEIFHFCW
jgi:hypothetical protein